MQNILRKVFSWMTLGLIITFITGYIVAINENMLYSVFKTGTFLVLAIVEIALVIFLSARITKMNPTTARITFLLYSFITGLTFSSIFISYEMTSIIYVFLIAALMFGVMSVFGYMTKLDLTKIGTYLFIGLIGVIIASIINIFVGNSMFEIIICIISIIIFLGFTAYDVKKIESLSNYIEEDNLAIYGALTLYLDFINLFIDLLRLFGSNRD